MQLEGITALVTGANRGIGAAFARALVEAGAAKVYAGARDPSTVKDPGVTAVALDVTDPAGVRALAAELGDVQLVINNAGISMPAPPLEIDPAAARREFDVNYFGPLAVSQAFAPVLARNGGGALVNVHSALSWISFPEVANYAATKAAAWSLTNALRQGLRAQGTLVQGVHVGYVDTDMTTGIDAEKTAPAAVADAVLAGLRADEEEVLVDEVSRQVRSALSAPLTALYPHPTTA